MRRMSESIPITITILQMTAAEHFRPSTRHGSGLRSSPGRAVQPRLQPLSSTRPSAQQWQWYERLVWTRDQWLAYLDRPEQETWVGYVQGTPAGYFELEHQARDSVEIVYFGLMPDFIGRGLGGVLLSAAVRRAWDSGHARVLGPYLYVGPRACIEQLPVTRLQHVQGGAERRCRCHPVRRRAPACPWPSTVQRVTASARR